jgi:DNA modification methylase
MPDLKLDPSNYRIHGEKNKRLIRKSLKDCGAGRSILLDDNDCIIAGNGVYEQAKELGLPVRIIESDGTELIAIKRTDLTTKDSRRKALALADNHTSDTSVFDIEAVVENFSAEDPDAWEFSIGDIDMNDIPIEDIKPDQGRTGCLNERFIIPPFSILDSKSGRWQERKRAWLSLGIKSDLGRETELTYSQSAQSPHVYEARNAIREKTGKDPSWDEVIEFCKAHNIPFMEGTSIFDPVLCELVYRWFNIEGGSVLDPFAGGSVRGIVASKLGMSYCGVDLRREQIEANYVNAKEILTDSMLPSPYWVCDDSLEIDKLFSKDKFDLLFSCPPYADLEVYSDNPRDLSNMGYKDFINTYREIISKSCSLLNDNRFAVFVVGEVRNKNGTYHGFVQDTIKAFLDAGLSYYNEMILVTTIGSLAMRVSNQFNNSRKIGKQHQNVFAFYKGDPKRIKEYYGSCAKVRG